MVHSGRHTGHNEHRTDREPDFFGKHGKTRSSAGSAISPTLPRPSKSSDDSASEGSLVLYIENTTVEY